MLPRLRESRGRVLFVSSVSGRIATPMTGAYNASKFGLEAMADVLRMELRPWGIRVVLIEPSQTDTAMWQEADKAADEAEAMLSPEHRALYAGHNAGFRKRLPMNQRMAVPADNVARDVERALAARRPRARYVVGGPQKVQAALAKVMPTPLMDALLRLGTGVPRRVTQVTSGA